MKRYFLAAAMVIVCGFRLFSQEEPVVRIKLEEEERFRFENYRLSFINPDSSVFIGDSGGVTGPFSRKSVVIGFFAGNNDTAGLHNVYIGAYSGYHEFHGTNNTYIGFNSGKESDSAFSNTFVGSLSGEYNTTGNINTFIGRRAGNLNTTGSENTFLGQASGYWNKTGSLNTYVGRAAGYFNEEGDSNVCIGYNAGAYNTYSNRLYISNSDTEDPLIYGEFDNKMLRFNAGRLEIRNPLENTIIGDSSGIQVSGNQNVIVGTQAGKYLQGSYQNVLVGAQAGKSLTGGGNNIFIGYQAGLFNTSSSGNVFIGMKTGWQNTSGRLNAFVGTNAGFNNMTGSENIFLGTSAGASNTTGNFNTYLGRKAGLNNITGSGNVFIGYFAGASELGSNKLCIANSGNPEPLIYGDFEKNKLKFHADTVQAAGKFYAAGEIRTDQQYNINGNPGVTDTINSVTSFDFTEQKLKYRTTIFNGGIATYVSPESGWVDEVGEYFTPCGTISIIGEFNEWAGDQDMMRDPNNPDLWSTTVQFTGEDDCHPEPCDSIIKVKFREDASWDVNWGSAEFPSGTGIQGGDSIPVPLDKVYEPTIYYVTFNCFTGEYSFENLSGYCPDSITDIRDNRKYATVLIGSQCWMAQDLNVGTRVDSTTTQTDNEIIEKYCYRDLESNCTEWGGLYQWNELMDYTTTPGIQGICPAGFHVPTDAEFKVLEGNVDSQFGAGSTEWNKTGWRGYDAGLNLRSADWVGGTDAFGFHALPGGYLTDYGSGQGYYDNGCCNCYPTSTAGSPGNIYNIRYMNGNTGNQINRTDNSMINDGISLRCVKD